MGRQEDNALAIRAAEIQNLSARYIALGEPMDKKSAENAVRTFGGMTNVSDGRTVILPLAAVGKILRHNGFDFSRIIKDIPELYKTSLFGWSEVEDLKPGHIEHNNIEAFHNYMNKFMVGKDEYYIRFKVREEKANYPKVGRNLIHSAAVSDAAIYKKDGGSQRI
ncbi:hypothetical protein R80B4_00354 [Fibrobacteres bacterium R8-0-B4]